MKKFKIDKQNKITLGILGAVLLLSAFCGPSQAGGKKTNDSSISQEEKLEQAEIESLLDDIISELDKEDQEIFGQQNSIRVYGFSNELLVDRENPNKLTRYEREVIRKSDFLMSFNGSDFYLSEQHSQLIK